MNTRAWFTIDELNKWADEYHLKTVKRALKSVQLSGEPVEIGFIYIKHLEYGLATFESLVKDFDLTCKLSKTSDRYIVEKPASAIRARGQA